MCGAIGARFRRYRAGLEKEGGEWNRQQLHRIDPRWRRSDTKVPVGSNADGVDIRISPLIQAAMPGQIVPNFVPCFATRFEHRETSDDCGEFGSHQRTVEV